MRVDGKVHLFTIMKCVSHVYFQRNFIVNKNIVVIEEFNAIKGLAKL